MPNISGTDSAKRVLGGRFVGTHFRSPGPGGWTFAEVPARLAPPVRHAWGQTPVTATVDGVEWQTSVWRGMDGPCLLAVPKKVRGAMDEGATVRVRLVFRPL